MSDNKRINDRGEVEALEARVRAAEHDAQQWRNHSESLDVLLREKLAALAASEAARKEAEEGRMFAAESAEGWKERAERAEAALSEARAERDEAKGANLLNQNAVRLQKEKAEAAQAARDALAREVAEIATFMEGMISHITSAKDGRALASDAARDLRAAAPPPPAAQVRCVECGHPRSHHAAVHARAALGCLGPDAMGCDCPGYAPAPVSGPSAGKGDDRG